MCACVCVYACVRVWALTLVGDEEELTLALQRGVGAPTVHHGVQAVRLQAARVPQHTCKSAVSQGLVDSDRGRGEEQRTYTMARLISMLVPLGHP